MDILGYVIVILISGLILFGFVLPWLNGDNKRKFYNNNKYAKITFYRIYWNDHKFEHPVLANEARGIVAFHLKHWPNVPIWLVHVGENEKF